MKREEQENLLVEYLLGKLDWETTEQVERMLRSDPLLNARLLEIQEGLESEIMTLDQRVNPSAGLKSSVMESLGFETTETEISDIRTDAVGNDRKAWFTSWVSWAGWGVAAAFVAISLFQMNQTDRVSPDNHGAKPALAIFAIPSDLDRNHDTKPMIREVVYADEEEAFDSLSEAEVRAEELWSRYVKQHEKGEEENRSSGFVVIDLQGKQGFAGFYDVKPQQLTKQDQQLWLYAPKVEAVQVGALPSTGDPAEGVYYFSLEGDDQLIDSFESVVPVISSEALPKI